MRQIRESPAAARQTVAPATNAETRQPECQTQQLNQLPARIGVDPVVSATQLERPTARCRASSCTGLPHKRQSVAHATLWSYDYSYYRQRFFDFIRPNPNARNNPAIHQQTNDSLALRVVSRRLLPLLDVSQPPFSIQLRLFPHVWLPTLANLARLTENRKKQHHISEASAAGKQPRVTVETPHLVQFLSQFQLRESLRQVLPHTVKLTVTSGFKIRATTFSTVERNEALVKLRAQMSALRMSKKLEELTLHPNLGVHHMQSEPHRHAVNLFLRTLLLTLMALPKFRTLRIPKNCIPKVLPQRRLYTLRDMIVAMKTNPVIEISIEGDQWLASFFRYCLPPDETVSALRQRYKSTVLLLQEDGGMLQVTFPASDQ